MWMDVEIAEFQVFFGSFGSSKLLSHLPSESKEGSKKSKLLSFFPHQ
jgi:hypothetical protein